MLEQSLNDLTKAILALSASITGMSKSDAPTTQTVALPIVTEEDIKTIKDAAPQEEPKKRGRPRKNPEEVAQATPRKRLASYADAQECLLAMGADAETQEEKDAAKRNRKRVVKHFKEDAEKLSHLAELGDDIWSRVIDYVNGSADDEDDDEV